MVENNVSKRNGGKHISRTEPLNKPEVTLCTKHQSRSSAKCIIEEHADIDFKSIVEDVAASYAILEKVSISIPKEGVVSVEQISEGLHFLTDRIEELDTKPCDNIQGDVMVYGTIYENDIFSIHPHCSCDKDTCTRCAKCSCQEEANKYYLGLEEVTKEKYFEISIEKYMTIETSIIKDSSLACDYCTGRFSRATNFLHKSSGTKISWYVTIGREMVVDLKCEWGDILYECLTSIQKVE